MKNRTATKKISYPIVRPIHHDEHSEIVRVSYSPTEADYEVHLVGGAVLYATIEEEAFALRASAVAELLGRKAA